MLSLRFCVLRFVVNAIAQLLVQLLLRNYPLDQMHAPEVDKFCWARSVLASCSYTAQSYQYTAKRR